jgi:large subunit ribosomal protein L13
MKTWIAKQEDIKQAWWIVDATDQTLGRLATQITTVLRGKNKPTFTPNIDCGDFVVVINSDKVRMTGGRKWIEKKYYRHSRFFGSLKEKSAEQMLNEDPSFILTEAVRGMLPTNRLSRNILKKLKVFKGAEHDHAAQRPQPMQLTNNNK